MVKFFNNYLCKIFRIFQLYKKKNFPLHQPASPSQHKRSHHSAASTSVVDASVIDSEHREIVEPNFDLKSLEAFKEFYEHIRVGELKGEVQDMVSHLKGTNILLFYNYSKCN
jgi:hypothetical protein